MPKEKDHTKGKNEKENSNKKRAKLQKIHHIRTRKISIQNEIK